MPCKIMLRKILVSEKELSGINFKRLKIALKYMKNNLTDSDNNMYLTTDSLIVINNVTLSNNITLKNVSVKSYRHGKMYMDENLIEDKKYQLVIVSINRSI